MEISPLLSPAELFKLMSILKDARNVVITAHRGPDGDAMGSTLAWADYLMQLGKRVTVVLPTPCPDFLRWLPGARNVLYYSKDDMRAAATQAVQNADLICLLDFNALHRLQDFAPVVERSKAKRIMIDHHEHPDTSCAEFIVSEPKACSTCELVFKLIYQLGGFEKMTRSTAACIYCGMMTDTGGFTFNSTRPEIYFIISELLTKGIDKDRIYRNVFNNYSHWAIRLRGHLMSQKLNYIEDMHASYFAISRMDMEEYHFRKGDAEGLVNIPLSIKGMKLSISLREDTQTDNVVWVSLRSVDDFPCNEMAAQFFNGGGHKNASGGRLDCSLDEACKISREAIRTWAHLLKD